jgi:NAD(P)H-flavin reductase
MGQAVGEVLEVYLDQDRAAARIACPSELIPAPGEYLLAYAPDDSNSPLPVSLFNTGPSPRGFLASAAWPRGWLPGTRLSLRGPLGHGFQMPITIKNVALVALCESSARLLPLLFAGMERGASVSLVSDQVPSELPAEVEVHPPAALPEVFTWADYLALDLRPEQLPGLRERLGLDYDAPLRPVAQALIHTSMPCGGMAACSICAVTVRRGYKLACKDGPVFNLNDLL